jgi:hypothetical protein
MSEALCHLELYWTVWSSEALEETRGKLGENARVTCFLSYPDIPFPVFFSLSSFRGTRQVKGVTSESNSTRVSDVS